MRDEELVFDRTCHEVYSEACKKEIQEKIALHYPSLESGEIAGISWQSQSEFFYYNKDVFAEAGIEETPKTFDELLDACAKFESIQKTPIAMDGAWRLLRYLAFVPYYSCHLISSSHSQTVINI